MSRAGKRMWHARCTCPCIAFVCGLHKPCERCCAATTWCSVHAKGIIVEAAPHGAAWIRGCIGFLSFVVRHKFSQNAQCESGPA